MKFVAILRGINVSGQKKIKMADLTRLFESLSLDNVQTYIQSGNVVFESKDANPGDLQTRIEAVIQENYQFHVPVVIRTAREIQSIVEKCPWGSIDVETDGTKVLLSFLASAPEHESVVKLKSYVESPEKLILQDREVYLHCPNGYGKSKLTNTLLERKLGVIATTRNWRTVCKLAELSG